MRFRIFPVVLVVLGVTLLLGNLGIVPREEIRYFIHTWWPLLLVGIGAGMLLLPKGYCRQRHCGSRHEDPPAASGSA
ncbi:MAG: hypothetical protein HZC24_15585 [Rhodocyclales bacterium]|nr:hypothetical protein [Rhodocyclales bacterium]